VADGAANSNQLCAGSPVLRGRIAMNQTKKSALKASPAATGIVCNNAAGELPRKNSASQ
jgi:ribosomal protein S12